jgi:hypothetical protein
MYLQKVKAEKIVTKVKNKIFNYCFAGILKVNDKNSKIRIQDPDPDPNPLVRGMDPRIPDPDPHQNVMNPEHWKRHKKQQTRIHDKASFRQKYLQAHCHSARLVQLVRLSWKDQLKKKKTLTWSVRHQNKQKCRCPTQSGTGLRGPKWQIVTGMLRYRTEMLGLIPAATALKGQCHEVFCFWFFSRINFPQAKQLMVCHRLWQRERESTQ